MVQCVTLPPNYIIIDHDFQYFRFNLRLVIYFVEKLRGYQQFFKLIRHPLQYSGTLKMIQIITALARALRDLMQFKILWLMIWPILLASSLWLVIGIVFWDTFSIWIFQGFAVIGVNEWIEKIDSPWLAYSIQVLIHMLVFIPLVMVTTLTIMAVFEMPALINLVAKRHYPTLKREQGGTLVGTVINALFALFIFAFIWVSTLPLWAFGVGMIVPLVAAAFINQQLFRYDALSEHANHAEMKVLLRSKRFSLWVLGLITGMLQLIPLLNFVVPTYTALVFIHYELARLDKIRTVST